MHSNMSNTLNVISSSDGDISDAGQSNSTILNCVAGMGADVDDRIDFQSEPQPLHSSVSAASITSAAVDRDDNDNKKQGHIIESSSNTMEMEEEWERNSLPGKAFLLGCQNEEADSPSFSKWLRDYPESISYQDPESGRTALHELVQTQRIDLASQVLNVCPDLVSLRDNNACLPVDALVSELIMAEERCKYSSSSRTSHEDSIDVSNRKRISKIWEFLRLLLEKQPSTKRTDDDNRIDIGDYNITGSTTILHVLFSGDTRTEIPMLLLDRAVQAHSGLLLCPDEQGNVPLHLIAMNPPPSILAAASELSSDEDSDDEDDNMHMLHRILGADNRAASLRNVSGKLPVQLAVEKGKRKLETGVGMLLDTHPEAVTHLGIEEKHYPLVIHEMQQLSSDHKAPWIYALLSSQNV